MIDKKAAGQAIRRAREAVKWSQSDLGKALGGLSAAAVSEWEKGNNITLERLFQIQKHLELDVNGLIAGRDVHEQNKNVGLTDVKSLRGRIVPRMSLQNARRSETPLYDDHVRSAFPCSENSFALIINDKSNAPEFFPGDSVIIDQEIAPEPEDMVFAYWGDDGLPIFRRFLTVGSFPDITYRLEAINTAWPSYDLLPSDLGFIVGVMSEHTRPRRR